MKRGQIQGQVFIYILTLIITGAILLFGYNAVRGLMDKTDQVELVKFKNELKEDFEKISTDYGSVGVETYSVPSKVKEICFYQEGEDVDFHPHPDDLNPLIKDSINDKTGNNVFLVMGDAIEPMELSKLEIKNEDYNLICIKPSGNRLKLRLEGLGDGVSIEQA